MLELIVQVHACCQNHCVAKRWCAHTTTAVISLTITGRHEGVRDTN
jgi:hypothetical protein